jgi:signal peptidase II
MKITQTQMRWISNLVWLVGLISLDRISKAWILKSSGCIYLTPFLSFELAFNRGIAWGIFHTASNIGFILVTLAVSSMIGLIGWYAYQQVQKGRLAAEELLILAGATSNLIDRLIFSGVIDFIALHWGDWYFPIFNLADVYIVLGVFWVLFTHYEK